MTSTIDRSVELLADAWQPALAASYRLGYADGHTAGRREAEDEMQAAWSALAKRVRAGADHPTREELAAARADSHDPCPQRCMRCSRCIHAEAWHHRGGRPYLGVAREAELARRGSR